LNDPICRLFKLILSLYSSILFINNTYPPITLSLPPSIELDELCNITSFVDYISRSDGVGEMEEEKWSVRQDKLVFLLFYFICIFGNVFGINLYLQSMD